MGAFWKAIEWITEKLKVLGGACLVGMTLLTCVDVIGRFFRHPIFGSVEIVGFMATMAVAMALLGIFMGTAAVVGYVFAPIPVPRRVGYAAIALMLLVQPAMFEGAVYANVIGAIAAAIAIGREVAHRRRIDSCKR